jgi:uncharacterized protein (DUF1800 family)
VQVRLPRPGVPRPGLPLTAFSCALIGALSFTTGCGTINAPLGNLTSISAGSASVRVNQQIQITSRMAVTAVPLTFFVNGVQGGNSTAGTITPAGLYTAPAQVPAPNTVTITATANGHPEAAPGSVTVAVLNPIPIVNSVTPSNPTEGNTTITVTGLDFVYGAQILWNGSAVDTTFVNSREVAAVVTAPTPGTYPLVVNNPNPGAASSGTLNVPVGPGKVVLKIQPGNTDVRVTNSLNLGLDVTGTANTGVTLAVNGIAGGNATAGTAISNSDGSITYTAPAVVPTPSNIVQLTITSVDNPTVFINQNISVLNPIPILTSATPTAFNAGTAGVVVTGQRFINGAQVLENGTPVPTTFNSGNQLTATLTLTQPGNFDIQVLNPSPGPATSSDLVALVNGAPPAPIVSPEDASRFLAQATFGATDADIHDVSMNGYQAWLNTQFALPPTNDEPFVEQSILINNPPCTSGDLKCNTALFAQNNQGEIYYQDAFWQDALAAPDELRQRVKYALSEMFVISSNNSSALQNFPRGEAAWYDMLGQDAFGNFRTLLNDVTLSPTMGQFLNMLGNDKGNANTDPDENYAREVMQLFTIGLYQLNDDGSQKLDGSGNPIPTYSNTDVMGLAKVFTGFSWNALGNTSEQTWSNCCLWVGPGYGEDLQPMTAYAGHHSTAEKDFLGVTIGAGSDDPNGDLKIALDTLFNHPNLPAFFSKQLIQHLVTSNPSPAYIGRVAAIFKDNGQGVRGDLKAVITSILLDPEARDSATDFANPKYGKVREALLRYTEWARAFTAQSRTGAWGIGSTEDPIWALGQMTLRSPTVFNWFAPGYVPPGTSISQAGLLAPEMEMTNVTTVVGYLNYVQDAIGSDSSRGSDIFSNYGAELNLAATPDALVDRINLLLMAGEMDGTLRNEILGAVNAIAIPSGSDQNAIDAALKARIETAVYLTMASPEFCAQF